MRVLIVDNNVMPESWGARDLAGYAARGGATVTVRRAPQSDLPRDWSGFDHALCIFHTR